MQLLSATAGIALAKTLREWAGSHHVGLKWPNDVWLDGRKACGILIEAPAHHASAVVLGIGVNVNNSMQAAPDKLAESATALCDVTGARHDSGRVLLRAMQHLDSELKATAAQPTSLPQRWQPFCVLTGRSISLEAAGDTIVGTCRGIDAQGAIVLQTGEQVQRFFTGTILAGDGEAQR